MGNGDVSMGTRVTVGFVLALVVALGPVFMWVGRMEARADAHADAVEGLRQEMKGLQQQMQDRFTIFEGRIDEMMRDRRAAGG